MNMSNSILKDKNISPNISQSYSYRNSEINSFAKLKMEMEIKNNPGFNIKSKSVLAKDNSEHVDNTPKISSLIEQFNNRNLTDTD